MSVRVRDKLTTPRLSFERVVIDSGDLGPLPQREPGVPFRYPAVAHVFGACHPSAVLRIVTRIVVNPVDLVIWRGSRSHVCKKGLKGFRPPLANGNAPSTVIKKSAIIRVGATCAHGRPRGPLRTLHHPMFYATGRCDIASKAPTRSNIAGTQTRAGESFHFTAYTEAHPIGLLTNIVSAMQNSES